MKKWLSWSAIAAFAAAGAACNGAIVPVGQDTGEDGGTHNTTGCTGAALTCPAYCEGKVPAAPAQCLSGTWTCVEPSCPAEPDSGPGTPDASSGCSATPPVCGPCPPGYPAIVPTCIQGQWECGDECAGVIDGGDDDAHVPSGVRRDRSAESRDVFSGKSSLGTVGLDVPRLELPRPRGRRGGVQWECADVPAGLRRDHLLSVLPERSVELRATDLLVTSGAPASAHRSRLFSAIHRSTCSSSTSSGSAPASSKPALIAAT
jgi:hypothetical protein